MASTAPSFGIFARHKWDRSAVLICLILIWVAILTGFGWDMIRRASTGKSLSYPLIVHAHALAYGAWLVLLAAQVWLVRTKDVARHRRLGMAVLLLWPMMVILGPAVAISVNAANANVTLARLSFMSTQFANVLGFTVLIAAGFMARGDSASHKRLMLMGTIAITEPGFSRVLAGPLNTVLGDGYWQYYIETYTGTLILMLMAGGYDLIARRRVHPVWIAAITWVLATQIAATWLYYQPFWLGWMKALTGH